MLNSRNCAAEAKWTWLSLKPGTTKRAFQIDDAGVWPTKFESIVVVTDNDELAVFDRDRLHRRILLIDGPDDAVVQDQIGLQGLLAWCA